jgi:hypothetical protein
MIKRSVGVHAFAANETKRRYFQFNYQFVGAILGVSARPVKLWGASNVDLDWRNGMIIINNIGYEARDGGNNKILYVYSVECTNLGPFHPSIALEMITEY